MTPHEQFARHQLEASGWLTRDEVYKGAVAESVLALIALFDEQGHSATSAEVTLKLFRPLALFEPLVE